MPRWTTPRWLLLGLVALLSSGSVLAADTWTTPFDGVRRLHRTTSGPNQNVNAVVVDLTVPGVSLRSTSYAERGRRTSAFANAVRAQVAINGDFFVSGYGTLGLSAGDGAAWPNNSDKNNTGNLAFGDARVEMFHPSSIVAFDPAWMKGVVSGLMAVVWDGTVFPVANDPLCSARHPRTAVGLSADKKKLFLAVVDGRSSTAVGMTCGEVGNLMKELGAHFAINLDGGGSATMFIAGSGVVNRVSDGAERTVANHLAVLAPPAAAVGTLKGVIYEAPDTQKRIEGATVRLSDGSTLTTDASGVYEFRLPPGSYSVTASKPGYAAETKSQVVALGQEAWASIGLTRSAAADFDGDGVADGADNCAELANPDQTDSDRDGVGDACDGDDDGDGVFDEDETCVPTASESCEPSLPGGGPEIVGGGSEKTDEEKEASPGLSAARGCSSSALAPSAVWLGVLAIGLLGRRRYGRGG